MKRDGTTGGAQREFAEHLERHRGLVLKVAAMYARTAADRADLAQDVAVQLWRAWPRYDRSRPLTTWMYRIALNVAISWVRAQAVRQRHAGRLDQLDDVADERAADPDTERRLRLLEAFVHQQAPLDRALLLLHLEDRGQREIAEILGLTETNVSTKLHRLKLRLRAEL
jgi:RNA polymerase sigma factor (sigma-70 family)